LIPKLEHLPASKDDAKLLWSYTKGLRPSEITDALDYQLTLWTELAAYPQGTWKGYAKVFADLRLDATFISDVGLTPFLPIHQGIGTTIVPTTANPLGASGMNFYDNKQGS
jgi:hypothetical protein